jgi:hypothetical protein
VKFAFRGLRPEELASRLERRRKATRVYDLAQLAMCAISRAMTEDDGQPLVPRLGVIADELERICERLEDAHGELVQVHYTDATTGNREMLAQGSFLGASSFDKWLGGVRQDNPCKGLEVVTESSPDLLVAVG